MRSVAATAFALSIVGAALAVASAESTASVGRPAKPFVLEMPGGSEVTLAMFRGKPLAINVFAAWCATCRVEGPRLAAASERYRGRVAFLGVDEQESASRACAFARDVGIVYPIALDDGQFAATYGAVRIPETIFVDARGVVASIRRGLISAADLRAELARIAEAAPMEAH